MSSQSDIPEDISEAADFKALQRLHNVMKQTMLKELHEEQEKDTKLMNEIIVERENSFKIHQKLNHIKEKQIKRGKTIKYTNTQNKQHINILKQNHKHRKTNKS